MALSNADTRAFQDHLHKLMFIKRLQEREGLMHKHFDGAGLLPSGGGLGRGGGLPLGRGLDDGGFSKRKPIIKQEMLTEVKVSEEDVQNAIADHEAVNNDTNIEKTMVTVKEEEKDDDGKVINPEVKEKRYKVQNNKNIKILGKAGTLFTKKQLNDLRDRSEYQANFLDTRKQEKEDDIADGHFLNHDPINFTGQTTSKGIVFTKDSGEVLKFRSIAALSKASGLSKYKILGKFKPKKTGDTLKHPTLFGGGTIKFVSKSQLTAATS